jgi:hypothetical protein
MRLKSLTYREYSTQNGQNPWELSGLSFGKQNLIVGKNATGKTRIINVIHNLARQIQQPPAKLNGEWNAHFCDDANRIFEYNVAWEDGKVSKELIILDGVKKLQRDTVSVKLYSEISSSWNEISPPHDRLVLHVRRDSNEFPFLETLVSWANGVRGFAFANTSPNMIEIPGNPSQLTSLNASPSALDELSGTQLNRVLKQLETMGYHLERASTGLIMGFPPNTKMIVLKEQGIEHPIKQFEVSQGMFRALSLLTIMEFLRSKNMIGTILLDDFGEGLDFERTKKMAEIIFANNIDSPFQIIATSNDSFLMNSIQLADLTICFRTDHKVECLNYSNSKEKFDSWQQLGLNNFDLFSSNYLRSNSNA